MTPEKNFKPWTAEEDALLRKLFEAGKSQYYVATKLKRSLISIRGRAYRLGISLKRRKIPLIR
jgi:hypothetical protein